MKAGVYNNGKFLDFNRKLYVWARIIKIGDNMGNIKHITPHHIYKWRAKILKKDKKYQVFLYDESPDTLGVAISPEFTKFKDLVSFMRKRVAKDEKDEKIPHYRCNYYKWLKNAYVNDICVAW